MYKFTDQQLDAIKQYEEAKKVFALIEKKYKKLVALPFKKFAKEFNSASKFEAELPDGKKLIYTPPRTYWAKRAEITTEYLVANLPHAFVEKSGYESVKLTGKKK